MQFPAAQSKHITRPCLSYWPAARSVPSWRGHCVSLSLFFFFSRSTFLSEYHTVAHSMPSIIQTVCPEKLSFASTVPEYFSRPRVFLTHMERHNGGHNEDILTLFFFFLKWMQCMWKLCVIITQQFHSFARCIRRTGITYSRAISWPTLNSMKPVETQRANVQTYNLRWFMLCSCLNFNVIDASQ